MTLQQLDQIKVYFIIGSGRSGTTLLLNTLNDHENCIACPEIMHLLYFYKKYHKISVVSTILINDLKKYVKITAKSRGKLFAEKIDYSYFSLLEVGKPINYGQVTKLMYLIFLVRNNNVDKIKVIVDKNPFYSMHTETILKVFPDAKFVTLVRDYHAYVLSNRQSKEPYKLVLSVYYYAYVWNFYIKNLMSCKSHHPDNTLIIRYEDWVNDPEKYLKDITTFYGLEYTNNLQDFYVKKQKILASLDEKTKKNLSKRQIKTLENLSKPINPSRVNSWKEKLAKSELTKIEFISAKTGLIFNYPQIGKEISFFRKLIYALISLPTYIRVSVVFYLKSAKIQHFLNVVLRATHRKIRRQQR